MLRILVFDEPFSVKLRLEGELTDRTVLQLAQRWAEVRSRLRNRKAILDLGDVVKVDDAGRSLLSWLSDAGVRFGYAHPRLQQWVDGLVRRQNHASGVSARFLAWLRANHNGSGPASLVSRFFQWICAALPPR